MDGKGCAKVLLEPAGGCGAWSAAGEVRQDRFGGLLVARLEVAESFLNCCRLLRVATLFVPLGGGAGQVQGREEHGYGEPVRLAGGIGEFLGSLSQRGGGLVVGSDH